MVLDGWDRFSHYPSGDLFCRSVSGGGVVFVCILRGSVVLLLVVIYLFLWLSSIIM